MTPRPVFLSVLILLTVTLTSCTAHKKKEVSLSAELRAAPLQIDVFSGRGFLGGSDYERYYLADDLVWRECGNVTTTPMGNIPPKPLAGDTVFPADPSLSILERRVDKITSEQQLKLKVKAAELFKIKVLSDVKEPLPGSVFSLSEPGTLEINIVFGSSKFNLLTSVDAVADKETPVLEKANKLFSALRGIGPVICKSETFFGIPRTP
jgi:hypothetical protein